MKVDTYIKENQVKYRAWMVEVSQSSYSPLDMAEFAIVSAGCGMERAIMGFTATRGVEGMLEVADTLDISGVFSPYNKASYIDRLRNDGHVLPHPGYREFRRENKLPGLGWAKVSFAACLADPFGSDIVCLDTHMLQMYGIEVKNHPRYFKSLRMYEEIEEVLLRDADTLGVEPFLYQWAAWDWKRGQAHPHGFLWENGYRDLQSSLFDEEDRCLQDS